METNANYVRVGTFTLLAIALFLGFLYWSVFATRGDERVPLLVRIEGSVTGLQQGSQVLFNGLPVGTVRSLRIDANNPRVVIASTEVDPGIPIKESTQANIGFQGLTGLAFVELRGGLVDQPNILDEASAQGTVAVIRANPSDVTDILATARDISERANNILGQFEGLVSAVGPSVRVTAENVARISENVDVFTASLATNSDDIRDFVGALGRLSNTANDVAQGLPDVVAQTQRILNSVDPANVNATIANVRAITQTVRGQAEQLDAIVTAARSAADGVRTIGETVQRNAPGIDRFIGNLAPLTDTANRVAGQIDTLVASIDSSAVNQAVSNVRDVTAAVRGKTPEIETIIDRTETVMGTLNATLEGFTQTRAQIDTLIASIDPGKVNRAVENVSSATDNVARAADSINSVASDIGNRRQDINNIISNVELTSDRLANASQRIDSVVNSVNSFLAGGADGTPLGVDTASTLRAIRDAARSIQSQIGPIASNVNQFSSQGLRDVRNLIQNINRTVDNIDNAVTNFSNNPSQLIYGGEGGTVRTYDGRNRR